jgi:hypothetical protein
VWWGSFPIGALCVGSVFVQALVQLIYSVQVPSVACIWVPSFLGPHLGTFLCRAVHGSDTHGRIFDSFVVCLL